MGLGDMMGRLGAGLKGKSPEDQGPVGDAVEILQAAIKQAKEKGLSDTSPTLKSISVLLDHTEQTRRALRCAVDVVNAFEDQGEWSEKKAKLVATLIQRFKLAAVKARLHQHVPEKRQDPFEKGEEKPV